MSDAPEYKVGDILTYTPGGIEVTVLKVYDRHIVVEDEECGDVLDPIYEDEYSDYVINS